jgi:hypothetical protein
LIRRLVRDPRFSGVRTFMRLPNTKGLPNAAIVGAPEIGGFTSREAQEPVQGLEIVGCDVV